MRRDRTLARRKCPWAPWAGMRRKGAACCLASSADRTASDPHEHSRHQQWLRPTAGEAGVGAVGIAAACFLTRVSQVVASLRVFVLVTGVWVVDLGH